MRNNTPTPKSFETAVDNYFEVSQLLYEDARSMLDQYSNSQYGRRTFIRVIATLIEGYTHCLRELSATAYWQGQIKYKLRARERKLLNCEQNFSTSDRIKCTVRLAYRIFDLDPQPDFGVIEWNKAKKVFETRNKLMHPKCRNDLEVSDDLWTDVQIGTHWLIRQMFSFPELLQNKYL